MGAAKLSAVVGIGLFLAGATGLAGTWTTAVGSVVLLFAAIAAAVASEASEAVEGLVAQERSPEPAPSGELAIPLEAAA